MSIKISKRIRKALLPTQRTGRSLPGHHRLLRRMQPIYSGYWAGTAFQLRERIDTYNAVVRMSSLADGKIKPSLQDKL